MRGVRISKYEKITALRTASESREQKVADERRSCSELRVAMRTFDVGRARRAQLITRTALKNTHRKSAHNKCFLIRIFSHVGNPLKEQKKINFDIKKSK